MKTSMLGKRQRRALVSKWPLVISRGVADEFGEALRPGDYVRLPLCVRHGAGSYVDVLGTVMGYALDKAGIPSVVVDAPAWNGRRLDSWRTWIVRGSICARMGEGDVAPLLEELSREGMPPEALDAIRVDSAVHNMIAQSWLALMLGGVRTRGGFAVQPGDLVRLPRNVARNRGSQLHAAGLCLGYAVGLDGSPCVAVDAVGEDVPTLLRWRTWVVRGDETLVIDTKEAWRLESRYTHDGRLRPRERAPRGNGK